MPSPTAQSAKAIPNQPDAAFSTSNILSKPVDVRKYSLIYAGAQKNIGPSGVTLVIISKEMLDKVPENQHTMLDYRAIASKGSMLNTPNTWGIYLIDLVCKWVDEQGGIEAMERRNEAKVKIPGTETGIEIRKTICSICG